MFYKKLADHKVKCTLCAHHCEIASGKRGICRVRENQEGVLYSLNYQRLIAEHIDPIEKKPLFHFYPGTQSYSIAAMGCNFRCLHCQNWSISQVRKDIIEGEKVSPERVVQAALHNGCSSISYTYTEPTIYFETAFEISRLAQQKGLKNVFVTNGFITAEALETIKPCLSAANVDLKSFRDEFYRKNCGAHLQPVLESLQKMKEMGIWVEITTLLIPALNDSDEELKDIAGFIADLGKETPWHISRFHPQFKMRSVPVTPLTSLHRAVEIGKLQGLKYVYNGNVPGDEGESTYCSNCRNCLIERHGFDVVSANLTGNKCSKCGTELEGIM